MGDLDAEVAAVFGSAAGRVIQRAKESEPGWLGIAMDQAVDLVRDHFEDADVQIDLVDALAELEQAQLLLEPLGKVGVRAVLRAVYDDEPDRSRAAFLFYLTEGATFEERRAAMEQSTHEAYKVHVRQQIIWETIQTILEQVGQHALKLLVPCLFAAV